MKESKSRRLKYRIISKVPRLASIPHRCRCIHRADGMPVGTREMVFGQAVRPLSCSLGKSVSGHDPHTKTELKCFWLDCRIRDTFGARCPERDSLSAAVGAHFLRGNQHLPLKAFPE